MSQAEVPRQANPGNIIHDAFAFTRTFVLTSAIELDIFTQIDDGFGTIVDLAGATGCSERGLRILLGALCGAGYLERRGDEFALTETAKTFLSSNSPSYFGGWLMHMRQIQPEWNHLTETVRSGKPQVDVHSKQDQGEFFSQFVDGLYTMNYMPARAAAEATLREMKGQREIQVLDIGAGSGVWGFMFAKLDPRVRVTALDWPKVLDAVTRKFAQREGLEARVSFMAGSLRELDFGENRFDVVTLGHICHGEGAENSRRLFARIRRALKPDGRLVIADFLPDESRAKAALPLMFGVNMLVHTDEGDVFTFGEYRQWLQEAGFADVNRIEFPADVGLIGARAAAVAEKAA